MRSDVLVNFTPLSTKPVMDLFDIFAFSKIALAPFVEHMLIFWTLCAVCCGIDLHYSFQDRLNDIKLQQNQHIDVDVYKRTALASLRNQLVVTLPLSIVMMPLLYWRGCVDAECSGNPFVLLFQFSLIVTWEEFWFYTVHRILHSPALYRRFHAQHHTFKSPIAVSAIYAHPFEHLFANLLPVITGPLVFGLCLSILRFWVVFSTINAILAHCGYNFSNGYHDIHHITNKHNFGVLGWMDYAFDTYKNPLDIFTPKGFQAVEEQETPKTHAE